MIEPKVYDSCISPTQTCSLVMICFDRTIEPHFAIQTYADGSGALLAYTREWHIVIHNNPYWITYYGAGGNYITREDFLNLVSKQPEIFEWLLWNPEWL